MEANAKVPPIQPVPGPTTPQTKTDTNLSQDLQAPPAPLYVSEPMDYRLVVDKDPVSGTFVYRTVNRVSGETVAQFPSEEIVRMRDSAAYTSGTIFDSKA